MKNYLLLATALTGCLATAQNIFAQDERPKMIATFYFTQEIPGIVQAVSDNGRYAVGYDEGTTNASFIWDRETKEFVDVFGVDEEGNMAQGYSCALQDVADDGTAVGYYQDATLGIVPGIYKDGTWTPLPTLVEKNSAAVSAMCISPDGSLIGGQVSGHIATSDALPGQTIETGGATVPVLWRDGMIERIDTITYLGQGCRINDMSPDGSMMCGWAEWDDGTRSPAVWKDGKMVRLIGTEPAISNPDKWEEFYEGQLYCFSRDLTQVGGYFSASQYSMEGILWTIPEDFSQENATDESVQIVETALTAGGNDGKFFGGGLLGGGGTVYYDGGVTSLMSYYRMIFDLTTEGNTASPAAINDVDAEERTFASSYVVSAMGGSIQCPLVICFDEDETGIGQTAANGEAVITYADNILNVEGVYNEVAVYSLNGNRMLEVGAGADSGNLDLGQLGAGVYIVKVTGKNYAKIQKVIVK